MPTEAERLMVLIEANTKAYERAMEKVEDRTNRALKRVEDRHKQAAARLDGLLGGVSASAMRLAGILGVSLGSAQAVRAITAAAQEYVALQNALKVTGLEGEDLDRVMGKLFAQAQRNGAALAPLVTLYGRVAQAQKELKSTEEDNLRFTEGVSLALRVAGTDATKASGAILQLSQAIGSGVVRAEEFNSVNEGARPILQAVAAGLKEAGGSVSTLKNLVTEGKVSSEAFFRAFLAGMPQLEQQAAKAQGTVGQATTRMANAFTLFVGKLDEATDASKNAADNINAVAASIEKLPAVVEKASGGLDDLKKKLNEFGNLPIWDRINKFVEQATTFEVYDPRTRSMRTVPGASANNPWLPGAGSAAEMFPAMRPGTSGALGQSARIAPVSLADFPINGKDKGKGNTVGVDSFERAIAAANKRIELQKAETSAIGQNTAARERAKMVAELETAAKAANAAAGLKNTEVTAAQRLQIEETANAMQAAVARNDALTRSFEAQNDALKLAGETSIDVINALAGNAEDRARALQGVVNSLIQSLMKAALLGEGPLAGLLGTKSTVTGGVGGLFGSLGALFGGFRAEGGNVQPGKAYVVGERQPELFVPRVSGSITPQTGGRGVAISMPVTINAPYASEAGLAHVAAQVAALEDSLPSRIAGAMHATNTRGTRP